MSEARQFFAIVFSRTETNGVRTDGVIRALSEAQALWIASHFTGEDEGAVALSHSKSAPRGDAGRIRVLDRFGPAIPFESDLSGLLKRGLDARDLPITLEGTRSVANYAGARQAPNMLRRYARRPRRGIRARDH
jgi:hypothetical protein